MQRKEYFGLIEEPRRKFDANEKARIPFQVDQKIITITD